MKLASILALALASFARVGGSSPAHASLPAHRATATVSDARASVAGDPSSRDDALAAQDRGTSNATQSIGNGVLERARARFDEARAAKQKGDHGLARAKAAEAIDSLLSENDDADRDTRTAMLADLGAFAYDAGELTAAKRARERVLEVRSRALADDDPNLQVARVELALTIKLLGDLRGARALLEKVLDVYSRTLPDDHPNLQSVRASLASTIKKLGDLQGARALEEKVLAVFSRTLPEDHTNVQLVRLNLAGTEYALGDLKGARELQEKVLDVFSRTLADDDLRLQAARASLASTMKTLGDLQGARALEERVLEIESRVLPDDHPSLQNARQNLAVTKNRLGDLQGARVLQQKVLEVRSRLLPDDDPDLQTARLNLGITIGDLGDLAGARALHEKALDVLSRTLPDDDPNLQAARQSLATTLKWSGDYASARALEEKVLEVRLRTVSDDHPDLQSARGNLASTLESLGELADARALEEKVLEVRARTFSDDHPHLQMARQNLAVGLKQLGDFEGARALEEKVLDVRSHTMPDDHPDLQRVRRNLAITIAAQCDRNRGSKDEAVMRATRSGQERCVELLAAVCLAQTRAVRAVLLSTPAREAGERCAHLGAMLDGALSFARGYGVFESLRELEPAAFTLSESARGAAIASAGLARKAKGAARYAELRSALVNASDELAALARSNPTRDAFDAALAKREKFERELIAVAREVSGGAFGVVDLDVSHVAQRLGPGATSVSFRRFVDRRIESARGPSDSDHAAFRDVATERLCAFVVRGGDDTSSAAASQPLTLVDLGPIEPIELAVREWRDAIGVAKGARGTAVAAATPASHDPRAAGEALRRLVLDPLLPAIGERERERVVLVPDDVLHLVAFDALPLDASGNVLVGDRWKIELRATLGELWEDDARDTDERSLLAIGGVDYDSVPSLTNVSRASLASAGKPPSADAAGAPNPKVDVAGSGIEGGGSQSAVAVPRVASASILRGGAWADGFPDLPATHDETQGLGAEFAGAFGAQATSMLLERADATRERLFELSPKSRFVHIATHGWFAPESLRSWDDREPLDQRSGLGSRMSTEQEVKGMSPMLLCGLALAGANAPEDAAGRAPGLITAEELAALDLSHCELVVLSACDTNVGERRAGQGVASLQKALQMAGARSVITSLWKVPDEATKELMLDFYRRLWVEKKPKHQALWEAKTKLREAKDERGAPKYTTRDWAAWVLTGAPD